VRRKSSGVRGGGGGGEGEGRRGAPTLAPLLRPPHQGKLKASLKSQHNDIKKRLQGSSGSKLRKVSKKTANRRRRT